MELAKRQKIDLLISDIGLPDMTGWEMLKQIRAIFPGLSAIAVSGRCESDNHAITGESQFNVHLIKPVEFSKIEAAITRLFHGK